MHAFGAYMGGGVPPLIYILTRRQVGLKRGDRRRENQDPEKKEDERGTVVVWRVVVGWSE